MKNVAFFIYYFDVFIPQAAQYLPRKRST